MSVEDLKKQIAYQEAKEKKNASPYLPDDFTTAIPKIAVEWLDKYGITPRERLKYRMGWTDGYESLVLPAYDVYGNLLLVQRRYFGTANFPRYNTKGYPESTYWVCYPLLQRDNIHQCVLVEDYVSAIKVGRQHHCMPLWGSNLSLNQIKRLSDHYENLVIWLDRDKAGQAVAHQQKSRPYFNNVSVVITEHDPKEYDDGPINAAVVGSV